MLRCIGSLSTAGAWVLLSVTALWHAGAQDLTWGTYGTGGSGAWDETSTNWWDGASNVTWISGATARFDGAPGTITVSGKPQAAGMVFTGSPCTLQPADPDVDILPSQPTFLLDVQNDAHLDTEIYAVPQGDILRRVGPGRLTLGSMPRYFDQIRLEQGETVAAEPVWVRTDLDLADDPSVILTLGPWPEGSQGSIRSLEGGGPSGGVIRAAAVAGTVALGVDGQYSAFSGRLEDQPPGVLALRIEGHQTLLSPSSYSGETTVGTYVSYGGGILPTGTLVLAGNGALPASAIRVNTQSTLLLDNTTTAGNDRLGDTLPIILQHAALSCRGNPSTPVTEELGPLTLRGACRVEVLQPADAPTTLRFASLLRDPPDMLDVSGTGAVVLPDLIPTPSGIVGPWMTFGATHWAAVTADDSIIPFADYSFGLSNLSPTSHVVLTAPFPTLPGGTTTVATLTLENPTADVAVLTLPEDSVIHLAEGGLMIRGAGPVRIQGGTIDVPSGPIYIIAGSHADIAATLTGTDLVKAGPGTLTLSGTNAFSGGVHIHEADLHLHGQGLGSGGRLTLATGELIAMEDVTAPETVVSFLEGRAPRINTGPYAVTLETIEATTLSKFGDGRLTLRAGIAGSWGLWEGELEILNAEGNGYVRIDSGTLIATGQLGGVTVMRTPDNGNVLSPGEGIGTLSLEVLVGQRASFTCLMDVSPTASDLLESENRGFYTAGGTIFLRFRQIGGVSLEQPYHIVTGSTNLAQNLWSSFAIHPDHAYAGWDVSLSTDSNRLFATFHAVGADVTGSQAPDGLRVAAADPGSVTLSWRDNTDLETAYELERALAETGPWQLIATLPPDAMQFRDSDLPADTDHWYRVRAISPGGATPYATAVQARTVESYRQWRTLLFGYSDNLLRDDALGLPANDLDGDSIPNAVEFGLGASPFIADAARRPSPSITEDEDGNRYFGVRFIRPNGWRLYNDPEFNLIRSTDPGQPAWTFIHDPDPRITVTDLGDGWEEVILSDPTPIPRESPATEWLRLQVNVFDFP
jgi:autotransporter-associated beta strand protein